MSSSNLKVMKPLPASEVGIIPIMCCRGATLRRHFAGNIWVTPSVDGSKMLTGFRRSIPFAAILLVATAVSAHAVDEIQVYNAEIAKVGQWTMQLHLNYAFNGRKEPDFPGGLIPHRALNGTPEWAYGITDWWEMGFYAPFAVDQNGTPYSNAVKIRQLFVTPNAAEREIFYGVNFEFSYAMPQFSDAQWNMEVRPIIGIRKGDYEFIVNPIVDIGFGRNGDMVFAPAARFARNFGENFALGIEYYSDLGPFPNFVSLNEQQHNIYAVVDFKIGRFDVNAGVGYGLTPGSDRLMAKMIIGTDLTPGVMNRSTEAAKSLRKSETILTGSPRP